MDVIFPGEFFSDLPGIFFQNSLISQRAFFFGCCAIRC